MKPLLHAPLAPALALTFGGLALAILPAGDPATCGGLKVGGTSTGHFGWAVDIDADTAVIGSPKATSTPGVSPGAAWVFERTGGAWRQTAHLFPAGSQDFDTVGHSVSVSADRILLGAPGHKTNGITHAGAAYVFERQGGTWVETTKLVASDPHPTDRFGISVALDGDTALVGANQHPQGGFVSGAAYVFERSGDTWVETQRLASSNISQGDFFGWSGAIEGDWLVVGAISADGVLASTGAAYVFQRTAAGWLETDKLEAPDGQSTDKFGASVAISQGRIAVGAAGHNAGTSQSGAVYVFEHDGATWGFRQKLVAPDPNPSFGTDSLGTSVAIDGAQILAGAPSNSDPILGGVHANNSGVHLSGSAYVFQHDGVAFAFSRKLRAGDPGYAHRFGRAVALSDGTALVGVYADDEVCPGKHNCEAGAAWFFPAPAFARGYCFGESCPCANHDRARGCGRSGGRGAALFACGSASVAADDLAFGASGLTPGQPALLFRGLELVNGGDGLPYGDGLRCTGGETRRLGIRFADATGAASWGPGLAASGGWQGGDTLRFQVWYRDPALSPCGHGFNTSSALEALFVP